MKARKRYSLLIAGFVMTTFFSFFMAVMLLGLVVKVSPLEGSLNILLLLWGLISLGWIIVAVNEFTSQQFLISDETISIGDSLKVQLFQFDDIEAIVPSLPEGDNPIATLLSFLPKVRRLIELRERSCYIRFKNGKGLVLTEDVFSYVNGDKFRIKFDELYKLKFAPSYQYSDKEVKGLRRPKWNRLYRYS